MLIAIVERVAPAELSTWWRQGLPVPGATFQRAAFFGFFAGIGRRSRNIALTLTAAEVAALQRLGIEGSEHWSLGDVARAAMLLRACEALPAAEHVGLLREAYAKGDNAERVAVLRTLVALPAPERFVELANEACRIHVLDVFAAIACENAYPSRYFSELHFNQLVMKSFFMELAVARIIGLASRKNAELARMAADFSAERRAAGRPVPADLGLVV